jgi:hypothetical protein
MFVFDILEIHSECVQICSGDIAPICTLLATGLGVGVDCVSHFLPTFSG